MYIYFQIKHPNNTDKPIDELKIAMRTERMIFSSHCQLQLIQNFYKDSRIVTVWELSLADNRNQIEWNYGLRESLTLKSKHIWNMQMQQYQQIHDVK